MLDDENMFYLACVCSPAASDCPLSVAVLAVEANPEVMVYQERQGVSCGVDRTWPGSTCSCQRRSCCSRCPRAASGSRKSRRTCEGGRNSSRFDPSLRWNYPVMLASRSAISASASATIRSTSSSTAGISWISPWTMPAVQMPYSGSPLTKPSRPRLPFTRCAIASTTFGSGC